MSMTFFQLHNNAERQLGGGNFGEAHDLWQQAAVGVVASNERYDQINYASALTNQARAIYLGELPGLDPMSPANEAVELGRQLISDRKTDYLLANHMVATTIAGRITLRQTLRDERDSGAPSGQTDLGLMKAGSFFDEAQRSEAALSQEFTHMVGSRDPKVIELAACSALRHAFTNGRDRVAVAAEARRARVAARQSKDSTGNPFQVALVAAVANRLVTPQASWRRRLAVRLATLPGVL